MDVGDDETQWTDAAKRAYQQRADELIEVLQAHVAATLSRTGRQRELEPYGESSDTLLAAARAFDDAEFDWCGSWPDDTDDDAVAQVPDLEHAAWELMHADGFDALKGLPSLRLKRDATTIIQHEGEDDESFDADPWAITQD